MSFLISLLITIVLRGSSQRNPFVDVFLSIVYFFIFIQVSSTILLFCGWLSPITAALVVLIPPLYCGRNTNKPLQFSVLYPFLPLLIIYVYFAIPPPFLRDSLTYHLSLSSLYAQSGSFVQTDEVIFGYFPQGWQAILAVFQSISSIEPINTSPRLLAVSLSMAIGFGITGILLEQKLDRLWAIMAGMMFLLIPTSLEFGTSCYVQPWLVLLSFYTVDSFLRGHSPLKIGMLVGLLCSLKYSSLFWALLFGLVYLYRKEAKFLGGIALTGSPFYLRNLWLKNNPVFPLGYSIFGGDGWDEWRALAYSITLENYGMGRDFIDYLLLPARLFLAQQMYDDFEGALGLGLGLLILGAVASFRSLKKQEYWLLYFSFGWFVLWSFQVQQVRFLMPAVPLFFLFSVPVLSKRFPNFAPIFILLSLITSITPFQQLWRAQKPLYFYQQGKDAYLTRQLPENYPVYQYLNELETKKIWLIWMRGYHYYLETPVRIDSVIEGYRFENLLYERGTNPQDIAEILRQHNISHLVINWRFFLHDENADRLGEGQTELLRQAFIALTDSHLLKIERTAGPVTIYSLSLSSTLSEEK